MAPRPDVSGRKSGRSRQTVLEVVRYDRESTMFVVAAGFGPKSDWYINIRSDPRVTVQCGRHKWEMVATFLTPAQAGEELLEYNRHNPFAMGELAGFMGIVWTGARPTCAD